MSAALISQLQASLDAESHLRRKGKYLTCPGCGAIFYRKMSELARVSFCTRECLKTHAKRLGVLAYYPIEERFWSKVHKTDTCWLWTGSVNKKGYGTFGTTNRRTTTASRFAYKLHHGVDLTPDQFVCHHCDNPPCVRPDHLFLGSNTENQRDSIRKGRDNKARGERNCNAKLTAYNVLEIRSSSLNSSQLGRKFRVAANTIGCIRRGQTWKHL